MNEPKRYEIASLEDLANTVTRENFDRLMVDVVKSMNVYISMIDAIRAMEPEKTNDLKNWQVSKYAFTWIDDGKNDMKAITIQHPNGEKHTVNF